MPGMSLNISQQERQLVMTIGEDGIELPEACY
jgi:hypothetical protein